MAAETGRLDAKKLPAKLAVSNYINQAANKAANIMPMCKLAVRAQPKTRPCVLLLGGPFVGGRASMQIGMHLSVVTQLASK